MISVSKQRGNLVILMSFVLMLTLLFGCMKEESLTLDPIAAEDIYETEESVIIPMDLLTVTENVTQEDIDHTMEYIEKTKKGEMKKREPLSVVKRGNGGYGIIDGNKTYSALKKLGATNVPAVVAESPYQKDVEHFDDLIRLNSEAEPEFHQLVTSLGEELKAEVTEHPALTEVDEIHRKANELYGGDYGKIVDVLSADIMVTKDELQADKEKMMQKYYVICIFDSQTNEEYSVYVMLSNSTVARIQLTSND